MTPKRNWLLFLPLIPTVALVATPWLPFVNSAHLWAGFPSMFVWPSLWVLAVVPALAAVEWGWQPHRQRQDPELTESGEEQA